MHTATVLLAVLVALGIPVFLGFSRAITSPLAKVPGPLLARFMRLWYFYTVATGQAHHTIVDVHKRYAAGTGAFYAPIVRLGPNLYSISTPEKAIYGVASNMPKSSWYDGWQDPARTSLLTDRNIVRHAALRRKFMHLFAMSQLLHFEAFVDEVQALFSLRLGEMAHAGKEVDMYHWLRCYAFDMIGLLTFGSRFGFLDEGRDIEGCFASLEAMSVFSNLSGIYAELHPFAYRILENLPGSGARGRSYPHGVVRRRIGEIIASRKDTAAHGGHRSEDFPPIARSFVDSALDDVDNPEKNMTSDDVLGMGISNVLAGSDTTALALTSILWHLIQNPAAMAKLRNELTTAIEQGQMTKDSVTFAKTLELPYLQACIKEALRLCGPTALPMWRVVQKRGLQLAGQYLPEGTEVGLHIWVPHYDRDVWGEDVEDFRPERWIEEDPVRLAEMEKYYLPWGLGSRTCSGTHIASLEINKLVPMLVLNFDMQLIRPQKTLRTQNSFPVRPVDVKMNLTLRK